MTRFNFFARFGLSAGDAVTMTNYEIKRAIRRFYSNYNWGLVKTDLFGGYCKK